MATVDELRKKLSKDDETPAARPYVNQGAPFVTTGELGERPFRLLKAFSYMMGRISESEAKTEVQAMAKFKKSLVDAGYRDMLGISDTMQIIPTDFRYLPDEVVFSNEGRYVKSLMQPVQYDVEEYHRIRKATGGQSFNDESLGGAVIAPPTMGALIPLAMNKSAVMRAGAKTVPLPPNGKTVMPRVTGAPTWYWLGENNQNTSITSTTTFGTVNLSAKKLMCATPVSNELLTYSSGAAEAAIREYMAISGNLAYDLAALYGSGANGSPKGLSLYTATGELIDYATSTPTPAGVATNGNVLKAPDGDLMIGLVEDRNFDADEDGFKWVMRSRMYRRARTISADAISAGDEAGSYKTDIIRTLNDKATGGWCGYEVVRSSQVTGTATKGSSGATLTEIYGGCWSKMLLGTFGAMAFDTFPGGLAEILADQTIIRGKMFGDVAIAQPGAFIRYKELKFTA